MSVMQVHTAVPPGMQSASALLVKVTVGMNLHVWHAFSSDQIYHLIHTHKTCLRVHPKGQVHTVLSSSLNGVLNQQSACQQ